MPADYTYQRQHRSPGSFIILPTIWLALLAGWVLLDASPVLLGIIAACTLPALWDLVRNPSAGLTLSREIINWHSGPHSADISLKEITLIRLDTRLDFSVRATVVLKNGRKIRIPFEATPPHHAFETALIAQNIKTERHHFSLRQ